MFKKRRFTGYGKMGDVPVTITYDNGVLSGEPQKAVQKVKEYLECDSRRREVRSLSLLQV